MKNNSVELVDNHKKNFSNDQKIVLNSVDVPQKVNIKIGSSSPLSKDAMQMNEAFELARIMYQEVLSPQLKKNEKLKRQQKETLMTNIFKILKLQFICTYVFVLILIAVILGSSFLNISENTIISIIKFIEFYITSIVVELLSILFFIVKNVFDTSITDLIKDFDKRKKKEKQQKR